jgi:hypothetical protein
MGLKRWGAKRDANEKAIRTALQAVGALIIQLSETGAPDLLVAFRGRVTLLEVKQAKGKATVAQREKQQQGWPVVTARTADEALKAIGAIR